MSSNSFVGRGCPCRKRETLTGKRDLLAYYLQTYVAYANTEARGDRFFFFIHFFSWYASRMLANHPRAFVYRPIHKHNFWVRARPAGPAPAQVVSEWSVHKYFRHRCAARPGKSLGQVPHNHLYVLSSSMRVVWVR